MGSLKREDELGRYRLIEQLGAGGFCESWLAEHTELGSQVTLKIPHDPEYRTLLQREGKILAQLDHPGIVRVLDMDLQADPPFVVQEYAEGRGLRELISGGPLEPGQALDLFRQLLDILDHAHREGVVHRDVKPENLVVDANDRLYLLDFGLGTAEEQAARGLLLDHSLQSGLDTSIAGTLNYMSPEQKKGESVDQRADLYAAGIVLFEMLTGRYPTLNDRPGRALPAPQGAALNTIYGRLVAPLDERFESAAEASRELDRLLERADQQGLPLLPAAADGPPATLPATGEPAVWMQSVPTGCGAVVGWTGLILTAFSVLGVLRGAAAFRFLVLLGLLLLLGFVRRKAVPWARCPYCRADRRVKRRWPKPWTCRTCKQPINA